MSLPNLALSWLLVQKGVDAVIPGGKRPEQVRQNIQASSTHLNTDDIKKIENILEIIKM